MNMVNYTKKAVRGSDSLFRLETTEQFSRLKGFT